MTEYNIYYSPEAYGLEVFEMIQRDDMSYSFDMFVIWKDKDTNTLYYADDMGCSCPSPFEDDSRETITRIDPYNIQTFEGDIKGWNDLGYDNEFRTSPNTIQGVIDKVKKHYKVK